MKSKKIGIIGVKGRFGSWFERFFKSNGSKVKGSDVGTKTTNEDVVAWADVVIICVPLRHTVEVLAECKRYAREGQLWMDIAGLKLPLRETIDGLSVEYVSLHPLFAPPAQHSWCGESVLVWWIRIGEEWRAWFESFLKKTEASVMGTEPFFHDLYMRGIQNLPHMTAIAMALSYREMELEPHVLRKFATRLARKQFAIIKRILSQDPRLYVDMQLGNSGSVDALNQMIEQLSNIRDLVEKRDGQGLVDLFDTARNYLGDEFLFAKEFM